MPRMRTYIVLFSLFFFSGCMFGNLAQLKLADPDASDFSSALAAEYLAYATAQSEQGHAVVADYFAAKGMQAWHEEVVEPEVVAASIPQPLRDRLQMIRDELAVLLDEDVTSVVPQQAARAQLLFDCWVKAAEIKTDTALCAEELQSALRTLEDVGGSLGLVQEKTQTMFFAPRSAQLTQGDIRALAGLAMFARGGNPYTIWLSGEADSAGEQALFARRVAEISKVLQARRLSAAHIRLSDPSGEKAVHLSQDNAMREQNQVTVTARIFVAKPVEEAGEEE